MKVADPVTVIAKGPFATSAEWSEARAAILSAIKAVDWPVGSGKFTINPTKQGNGVKPIKATFVERLRGQGWQTEKPIGLLSDLQPGNLDFLLSTSHKPIAIEWETGNVSSCHRSVNKLVLGLHQGVISAGVMIVASRDLYRYLTDRIGNFAELQPYFPLWAAVPCEEGVLEILAFEHDGTDAESPLIPKGRDGNARKPRKRLAKKRKG